MNLRHLDCIICIAEYRVRWSPFCDIFSRAWMGVQHGTFRPTLRLFQWPFNVFLFRTCGLVKAYRVANRCPLSMRCRVYLFLVVVSWCLGEAFIGYVAGMTGKTLGQCRHCRQNQTWMTCRTLQLWVAAARFHWSCSAYVVRLKSQHQAVKQSKFLWWLMIWPSTFDHFDDKESC